jgi:hypothetical protein
MTTTSQTVLIGVFAQRSQAERFVEELKDAGFRDEEIGVASPAGAELHPVEDTAVAGALTGGAVGVFAGLVMGLGLVPGVGPVLLAGVLASVLGGAAVGATTGGLLGALLGLGMPADYVRRYEEHLREGRTLVVVKAAGRYAEALAILRSCEAHELPPPCAKDQISTLT